MKKIDVLVGNQKTGELFFEKESDQYGFNYTKEISPISLIMPYKKSTYIWKHKLHPIFDMNLPEGYLFEVFKNLLSKEYGYLDDFLIFSYLSSNIQGRLCYKSPIKEGQFGSVDIQDVLENDNKDTFSRILNTFLNKNAISGVQPKTLALLKDKSSLSTNEYIIKTWGAEFPQLALNEYFCLKAVQKAGVEIPKILLSKNNNFLLVKRFNYNDISKQYLGFEEVLVLQGKNKDEKYSGSYESVAKVIYAVTTNKLESMQSLYKTIVMNYLLKNGDAHLKNFGVVYDQEIKQISFAPAYDIVNTCVYLYKDRPALTMFGQKIWFVKKELIKFGTLHCFLSQNDAEKYYEDCIDALKQIIDELISYIKTDKQFVDIGSKMIDTWVLSLNQTKHKELPVEIIRNWKRDKEA